MVPNMNRPRMFSFKKGLSFEPVINVNNIQSLRKLIFIFQVLALTTVLFVKNDLSYTKRAIFAFALIAGLFLATKILAKVSSGDSYILLIALMLFSIGSIMIYRLEPDLAFKQAIWLYAGLITFFLTLVILKKVKGWENRGLFYFFSILVLFIATIVFGTTQGGAQNWIYIGPLSIQPGEFIKIILVFLIAYHYANIERIENFKFKGLPVGPWLLMGSIYIFIGMLFIQAELGTALIFYALLFFNQFIYEKNRRQLWINLVFASLGGLSGYILFDHIKIRVATWINPWKDIDNTGYQITQSLFAIGSGGFFGTGIGMGRPNLIPRAYTDFIFSAICEEMGILAGAGVIMLFLLLVYRGFKIALSIRNKFYSIVALGISISFAMQAFIILGGVMKIIPLTGITVPFVTYGGSSIMASFLALGVLQYTSELMEKEEAGYEQD